ncbi:MAG TPA: hypothetical protein PLE74_01035 [Candidatus Cloacimonadota bacterium]|nr:hypothetical protein [Candidatus Cloacimonadota bacterium]
MKRLEKCECGNDELEVLSEYDHYEEDSMTRQLKCTKCEKIYEETWKLDSVIAVPPKKFYLITEQNTPNENENSSHDVFYITKAMDCGDAIENWRESVHDYTELESLGSLPKVDVGEAILEITGVKEITKEEFITYGKVFKTI